MPSQTLAERFWAKVEKTDGCWYWKANIVRGYGKFGYGPVAGKSAWRTVTAHRLAYEWLVGPIPEGLQLDHLCRNKACVNPAHLEPVTPKVNQRRGPYATKLMCKNGHAFTPDNTAPRADGQGLRQCRACRREITRRYRARKKAALNGHLAGAALGVGVDWRTPVGVC